MFQNFIISVSEHGRGKAGQAEQENKEEQGHKQDEGDEEKEVGDRSQEEGDGRKDEEKGTTSKERTNMLTGASDSHTVRRNSSDGGVVKKFTKAISER